MIREYRELTQTEPRVEVIHAGLECGLFSGKMEGLDAVAIGPEVHDIHTPRERISLSSIERTWTFIQKVLKAL
jgi:dipeptidase D